MSDKFKLLYKSKYILDESQEKRREDLLRHQKKLREKFHDLGRDLEEEEQENPHQKRTKTFKDKYKLDYSLQEAEWLRERPSNYRDWYLVPYPKGHRCLVISSSGKTEVYNKRKKLIRTFKSYLPGGGLQPSCNASSVILDCVYILETKTYQILDCLAFGNQELLHCETEFRFFWTKSRLEDYSPSEGCDHKFLPPVYYELSNPEECLLKYPFYRDNPLLDGLLFYHRESSYNFGKTPLVGWLYPFMVEEILGLAVNPMYHAGKPLEYNDALSYMDYFDEKLAVNKKRKSSRRKGPDESNDNGSLMELQIDEE